MSDWYSSLAPPKTQHKYCTSFLYKVILVHVYKKKHVKHTMTILKESSDKTITVQLMDQLEIWKVVDPNFWLNINIRNCKNLVDRVNGA